MEYERLSDESKEKLLAWINERLRHSKAVCKSGSYALKHLFHSESGIYVTNGQFKQAMIAAGYRVHPRYSRSNGSDYYYCRLLKRKREQHFKRYKLIKIYNTRL